MPLPAPDFDKVLKYRELRRLLARHGVVEQSHRGKGAHRQFIKIIDGRPVVDYVTCHSEGQDISRKIVCHVREKFKIPIEKFYE